jgi:glucosamine kinase
MSLLREALQRPAGWLPERLMMGLAGSLQETRRRDFLALIPQQLPHTLVTDGHAQLMGASGGKPAICLAIGTGSVLHWLDLSGQTGMVGGWGFPVGDEGSGAWLGMRLVQLYLWHRDGRRLSGTLIDAIEQRIGTSVSAIQQWSTQCQSSVLARLAPLAFEHAATGDTVALSLLHEATTHALALVSLAPDSLPVIIVGGVGEQLRPCIAASLGARVVPAEGDALHGLWLLSLQPTETTARVKS